MKKFILASLSLFAFGYGMAQKSSSESLTIVFTIDPSIQLPKELMKCKSTLVTPMNPLTTKEQEDATKGKRGDDKTAFLDAAVVTKKAELAKTYLGIAGRNSVDAGEDVSVTLTTTNVTVSHVTEANIGDLKMDDELFRYSLSATLTVKDNTGKVWLDQLVVDPANEQKIPKASMYANPAYRMAITLHKNNPDKIKDVFKTFMINNNAAVLEDVMKKADQAIADGFEIQERNVIVGLFSIKGKSFAEVGAAKDNVQASIAKFRAFSKKNRIPKQEVDKTFGDAVVVWEKAMTEKKSEMEEKAAKGLALNCALASAWRNEYDKANSFLASVEEAKSAPAEPMDDSSAPMGAVVILSFQEYASNLNGLVSTFSQYKERIKLVQ